MTTKFGDRIGAHVAILIACAMLLGFTGGAAHAQAAVDEESVAPTLRDIVAGEEQDQTTPDDAEAAVIDGFRSAKFGMTDTEVLQAILDDFGITDSGVDRERSPLERTTSLIIRTEDLLPESGPAVIYYILGYSSQELVQVNILWGAPIVGEEDFDPQTLVVTANALQAYFAGQRYAPDTAIANLPLEDGTLIVFTGSDEQGRQVTLSLISRLVQAAEEDTEGEATEEATGEEETGGEEEAVLVPALLRLSYVSDPANPDIFRVEPGSF